MLHEELRRLDGTLAVRLDDRPGRAHREDDVGMFAALFRASPLPLVAADVGGCDLSVQFVPGRIEVEVRLDESPIGLSRDGGGRGEGDNNHWQ